MFIGASSGLQSAGGISGKFLGRWQPIPNLQEVLLYEFKSMLQPISFVGNTAFHDLTARQS
jgi:hypothetical protein